MKLRCVARAPILAQSQKHLTQWIRKMLQYDDGYRIQHFRPIRFLLPPGYSGNHGVLQVGLFRQVTTLNSDDEQEGRIPWE
jgi:hypothetical protein